MDECLERDIYTLYFRGDLCSTPPSAYGRSLFPRDSHLSVSLSLGSARPPPRKNPFRGWTIFMVDSGDRSGNSGCRALNPRVDFMREMLAAMYIHEERGRKIITFLAVALFFALR